MKAHGGSASSKTLAPSSLSAQSAAAPKAAHQDDQESSYAPVPPPPQALPPPRYSSPGDVEAQRLETTDLGGEGGDDAGPTLSEPQAAPRGVTNQPAWRGGGGKSASRRASERLALAVAWALVVYFAAAVVTGGIVSLV